MKENKVHDVLEYANPINIIYINYYQYKIVIYIYICISVNHIGDIKNYSQIKYRNPDRIIICYGYFTSLYKHKSLS